MSDVQGEHGITAGQFGQDKAHAVISPHRAYHQSRRPAEYAGTVKLNYGCLRRAIQMVCIFRQIFRRIPVYHPTVKAVIFLFKSTATCALRCDAGIETTDRTNASRGKARLAFLCLQSPLGAFHTQIISNIDKKIYLHLSKLTNF